MMSVRSYFPTQNSKLLGYEASWGQTQTHIKNTPKTVKNLCMYCILKMLCKATWTTILKKRLDSTLPDATWRSIRVSVVMPPECGILPETRAGPLPSGNIMNILNDAQIPVWHTRLPVDECVIREFCDIVTISLLTQFRLSELKLLIPLFLSWNITDLWQGVIKCPNITFGKFPHFAAVISVHHASLLT